MNGIRGERVRGLAPAGRASGPVTGRVWRGAVTGRVLGSAPVRGRPGVVLGVARPGAGRGEPAVRGAAGRGGTTPSAPLVPPASFVSVAMSVPPRVMLLA